MESIYHCPICGTNLQCNVDGLDSDYEICRICEKVWYITTVETWRHQRIFRHLQREEQQRIADWNAKVQGKSPL